MPPPSFQDRLAKSLKELSPAEQRVAQVFDENREEVLHASAAALAAKAKTSDATVVRTARALGFSGMDDLRQTLARELKHSTSLAKRLTDTLRHVGDDLYAAFNLTLDIHLESLARLRRDVSPDEFKGAVEYICGADRVVVFGIGPSSAMADYFCAQLNRLGVEARALVRTGILFADDLRQLRAGDVLVAMAYTHVYQELEVLLSEAGRIQIPRIMLTDDLGIRVRDRTDLILNVARGRADLLSMHTATLALIESLLVGVATKSPGPTVESLKALNDLREKIAGKPIEAPAKRRS